MDEGTGELSDEYGKCKALVGRIIAKICGVGLLTPNNLWIRKRETGADGCCEGLITGCDQLDIGCPLQVLRHKLKIRIALHPIKASLITIR
jgi:hypothetical protein